MKWFLEATHAARVARLVTLVAVVLAADIGLVPDPCVAHVRAWLAGALPAEPLPAAQAARSES